jgi:hypothetical protein
MDYMTDKEILSAAAVALVWLWNAPALCAFLLVVLVVLADWLLRKLTSMKSSITTLRRKSPARPKRRMMG